MGGHEEEGTDAITPVPLLCDQCVSKDGSLNAKGWIRDKGQVTTDTEHH